MISRSSALTGRIGALLALVIIALTYLAMIADMVRFLPDSDASYPNVYAVQPRTAPVTEIIVLGAIYAVLATIGWTVSAQQRTLIPALLCIGLEFIIVVITFVLMRDSGVRYGLLLVPLIVQTSALPLKPRLVISGAVILILILMTLGFYNLNTLLRDFTARQLNLAVIAVLAWLLLSTERTRSEAQFLMLEMRKSNKRMRDYTHEVEARTSELSALLKVSQTIVSALDRPRLIRKATAAFKSVVDYRQVFIYSANEDGTFSTLPMDSYSEMAVIEPERAELLATIRNTRQALVLGDIRAEHHTAQAAAALLMKRMPFVQSWMGIPLIARDRLIGVIAFEHDESGYYDAHRAELAWVFANQLASAMEHAQLLDSARQTETSSDS
ncbi:GAF domain-containing protein [Anaerolineae bacterium CFX9]|nr:GAF domain-containing protein [Anaerolineae bacterium CFX9]